MNASSYQQGVLGEIDKSQTIPLAPTVSCLLFAKNCGVTAQFVSFARKKNNEDYQEQPALKKRKPVLATSEALLEGIVQETSFCYSRQAAKRSCNRQNAQ